MSLNSSFCNENTSRILFRSFTVMVHLHTDQHKKVFMTETLIPVFSFS